MRFRNYVNSRKLSWTIVGFGIILSLVVFWILPEQIPIHINSSGIVDNYSNKIWVFLFPFIQLIIMFFTGRKKVKYCFTHSRTFLNDFQYNWVVSGLCFFILLVEMKILFIVFI